MTLLNNEDSDCTLLIHLRSGEDKLSILTDLIFSLAKKVAGNSFCQIGFVYFLTYIEIMY